MEKILMVCLGNICRSPVAEGVMRHVAEEKGLQVTVDSAGTSNYHIGEHPDARSRANALKHGVDIGRLKARQFQVSDFEDFDRIYVMDRSNYRNVIALAPSESHEHKVKLLLNELHPGSDMEVPDPYFGGEQGFEQVFQLIEAACEVIGKQLIEKKAV